MKIIKKECVMRAQILYQRLKNNNGQQRTSRRFRASFFVLGAAFLFQLVIASFTPAYVAYATAQEKNAPALKTEQQPALQ